MNEKIAALKASFESELSQVADMAALEALRVSYLGKKGLMTELLKGMGNMSVEERKTIGAETNELKTQITVALGEKLEAEAYTSFDLALDEEAARKSDAYANEIRYFTDCVLNDTFPGKVKAEELKTVINLLNGF